MGFISGLRDSISKVTGQIFSTDDPKRIGIYGPPNAGKCLAADEEVLLSDGSKHKIKNIFNSVYESSAGEDLSEDPTETWIACEDHLAVPAVTNEINPVDGIVSHVFRQQYSGHMYKVSTESGRQVTVSPEHPFVISDDTNDIYRQAKHLYEGQMIAIRPVPAADGGTIATDSTPMCAPINRVDWEPVETIEIIDYDGYIYDLTVEDHHTFTTRDGIVVHNTTLANRISRDWTGDAIGPESHIPHETREAKQKTNVEIERNGRTVSIDIVDTPGVTTKVDYEEFLEYDIDEEDAIERSREATEGVAEAMHWLREDIEGVIYVLDSTEDPLIQVNTMLIGIIESRDLPVLILANKIDLEDSDIERVREAFPQHDVVELSALEGDNMDEVYDKIAEYFG